MNQIKFVYFDVGGVSLLDFSGTNKWHEMKAALGVTEANKAEFEQVWNEFLPRICIDCDVDTIVPKLLEIKGITASENYSMLNDFIERFEVNPSIWPVIIGVKERYKVGLLTNMYPRMLAAIVKKKLIPDVNWDAVADSSVLGYQKPQPQIYAKAEEMAGVQPEEILFVDNSLEHLDASAQRDWKTFLYDPQQPDRSSSELASLLKI